MNAQFCKVGATNTKSSQEHTGYTLENQIEVFQQKAVAYAGTPLQEFFEGKIQKIKRILERRGA